MHGVALTLPFGPTNTDVVAGSGPFLLYGWTWQETTNSASASVNLYDGLSTNGVLIVPVTLNQFESTRDLFAAPLLVRTGLFVNVLTGEVEGTLFATPVERLDDDYLRQFGLRV